MKKKHNKRMSESDKVYIWNSLLPNERVENMNIIPDCIVEILFDEEYACISEDFFYHSVQELLDMRKEVDRIHSELTDSNIIDEIIKIQ